jgi:hypothetical protein
VNIKTIVNKIHLSTTKKKKHVTRLTDEIFTHWLILIAMAKKQLWTRNLPRFDFFSFLLQTTIVILVFIKKSGTRRRVAYHCIKKKYIVLLQRGPTGHTHTGYNSRGLYGKKDNLNPVGVQLQGTIQQEGQPKPCRG